MAGKLDFTASANTDKALADLAKVVNKQEQMISKLKQQNSEAKKTTKSFEDMDKPMGSIVGKVGEMAAGFLTAQAAVGVLRSGVQLLKDEFADYQRKTTAAANSQFGFNQAAVETIRSYYGVSDPTGQQLDRQVGQLRTGGPANATPMQKVEMLNAFGGANPSAPWEQAMSAIELAGGPISQAGRVERAGMIGQLGRFFPNKSTDDMADLAALMTRDAGERASQLPRAMQGIEKLQSVGVDPEIAMSRIIHGMQKKMKPAVFSTMATNLVAAMDRADSFTKQPGKPLTESDKALMSIKGMTGNEILSWADTASDSDMASVFGTSRAQLLPMFGPGVGTGGLTAMNDAMSSNLAATEAAGLRASGTGGMVAATEQGRAVAAGVGLMSPRSGGTGTIRGLFESTLSDIPGIGNLHRKAIMGQLEAGMLAGDASDAAVGIAERYGQRYMRETMPGYGSGMGFDVGEVSVPNPDYNPDAAKVFQDLKQSIERLAASIDKQEANRIAADISAGMD